MVDHAEPAKKQLVLSYIEDVINGRRVDLLDQFIAPGYRGHGFQADREALRSFLRWQQDTAPDWRIQVEDVVSEGDRVVVRATASGHQSERERGASLPTPVRREVEWIAVYR